MDNGSALYEHSVRIYAEMAKTAEANEYGELVYEGKFTSLFDGLGISRSYYTRIRAILRKLGCIEMLSRGAAGRASRIKLIREPAREDFTDSTLTERRETAILVRQLQERVTALEAWRLSQTGGGGLNVVEALRNHERRISQVEQERENAKATHESQG